MISLLHELNHPLVFECLVLGFVLDHQLFPRRVVSFTLLTPSKSHLASLKVSIILKVDPFLTTSTNSMSAPHRPAGSAMLWEKSDF